VWFTNSPKTVKINLGQLNRRHVDLSLGVSRAIDDKTESKEDEESGKEGGVSIATEITKERGGDKRGQRLEPTQEPTTGPEKPTGGAGLGKKTQHEGSRHVTVGGRRPSESVKVKNLRLGKKVGGQWRCDTVRRASMRWRPGGGLTRIKYNKVRTKNGSQVHRHQTDTIVKAAGCANREDILQ